MLIAKQDKYNNTLFQIPSRALLFFLRVHKGDKSTKGTKQDGGTGTLL